MNEKYSLKNFDNFVEYEGASEGSGRSRKIWLKNDRTQGLFKYPKSDKTYDYFSEILAYDIAKLIQIPVAEVEIGHYKASLGSMSYLINIPADSILIEGVHFIIYIMILIKTNCIPKKQKNITLTI